MQVRRVLLKQPMVFISALLVGLTAGAQTPSHPFEPPRKNCIITINTKYKDGETATSRKFFQFSTKAKCESTRLLMAENFSPKEVSLVHAEMKWLGK